VDCAAPGSGRERTLLPPCRKAREGSDRSRWHAPRRDGSESSDGTSVRAKSTGRRPPSFVRLRAVARKAASSGKRRTLFGGEVGRAPEFPYGCYSVTRDPTVYRAHTKMPPKITRGSICSKARTRDETNEYSDAHPRYIRTYSFRCTSQVRTYSVLNFIQYSTATPSA
jgi:hypothetical protein